MSPRIRFVSILAVVVAALMAPRPLRADKLDKAAKQWLQEVAPIILPDEEKQFKDLKKGDREEFEKIFWARRDPDLGTPENEFRQEYEKARTEADQRFRVLGRPGSTTDCGRVFILLGPPDEVHPESTQTEPGRRAPETWTYKSKPGGISFTGGEAEIYFDQECRVPQGSRLGEQLKTLAQSKIAHPNLGYRIEKGHLVKLEDLLPKPSPAQALLKTPRQDFELTAEKDMVLKSPTDGAAYLAGLVRGDASALPAQDVGGRKMIKLKVAASVTDEAGKPATATEREITADVDETDHFVASWGMALRAGKYSLTVGALDPASGKGSAVTMPLEAPAYPGSEVALSTLLVLADIQQVAQTTPEPTDPLANFALGPLRLKPHYGNVFTDKDSVTVLCAIYTPTDDPTAAPPKLTVNFEILKGQKKIAAAPEQVYDSANPTYSVGPVPLSGYQPGSYTARIRVKDVAGKEYKEETPFEIKGSSPSPSPVP